MICRDASFDPPTSFGPETVEWMQDFERRGARRAGGRLPVRGRGNRRVGPKPHASVAVGGPDVRHRADRRLRPGARLARLRSRSRQSIRWRAAERSRCGRSGRTEVPSEDDAPRSDGRPRARRGSFVDVKYAAASPAAPWTRRHWRGPRPWRYGPPTRRISGLRLDGCRPGRQRDAARGTSWSCGSHASSATTAPQ